MGHIKTLKLAKQFIKAQGGFTVAEVEHHYLSALRAAKDPVEYGALLEEWRRVTAGWVAPWMMPANSEIENLRDAPDPIDQSQGVDS